MVGNNPLEEMEVYAHNELASVQEPTNQDIGHDVGQTLPAAWWNWLWKRQTTASNNAKVALDSVIAEIGSVLSNQQITPDSGNNAQLLEAVLKIAQAKVDIAMQELEQVNEAIEAIREMLVPVTQSNNGFMTYEDKVKLDGIAEGANNYILPVATDNILGGVKIGTNISEADDGKISVPAASASANGVVTTTAQTFSGKKTFNGGVAISSSGTSPTPAAGSNDTNIATTAWVRTFVGSQSFPGATVASARSWFDTTKVSFITGDAYYSKIGRLVTLIATMKFTNTNSREIGTCPFTPMANTNPASVVMTPYVTYGARPYFVRIQNNRVIDADFYGSTDVFGPAGTIIISFIATA